MLSLLCFVSWFSLENKVLGNMGSLDFESSVSFFFLGHLLGMNFGGLDEGSRSFAVYLRLGVCLKGLAWICGLMWLAQRFSLL